MSQPSCTIGDERERRSYLLKAMLLLVLGDDRMPLRLRLARDDVMIANFFKQAWRNLTGLILVFSIAIINGGCVIATIDRFYVRDRPF
jgi:hypothetical protein